MKDNKKTKDIKKPENSKNQDDQDDIADEVLPTETDPDKIKVEEIPDE